MAKKFLLFSKEEYSMTSNWTDTLYCSILRNGKLSLRYNVSDDYGSYWFLAIRNLGSPSEFMEAFRSFERLEHWNDADLLPQMHVNHPIFAARLEHFLTHEELIKALDDSLQNKINLLVNPIVDSLDLDLPSGSMNKMAYVKSVFNFVQDFLEKKGELPQGIHVVSGREINFPET